MGRTRPDAREEGSLARRNGLEALKALAVAVVVVVFGPDAHAAVTEELGDDAIPAEIVDVLAGGAGAAAVGYGAAAAWRTTRWRQALRYDRMAADPALAALVPPRPAHDAVLGRPETVWVLVGMGVAALFGAAGFGLLPEDTQPEEPATSELSPGAALAVAGAVLALVAAWALWRAWRWAVARRVERLSAHASTRTSSPGAASAAATGAGSRRATRLPDLRIVSGPARGATVADLTPVTARRNVLGGRPWQIAYLRLFDNERRVREFLRSCWRECGYVHLIRSADSVAFRELSAADRERLFIAAPDRLRDVLYAQPTRPLPPGRHGLARIAERPVRVRDRRGSYPVRTLLCHATFWQSAVDLLLGRVDVVVLDLSGFRRENLGTGWELQRVVDSFPVERTVLLSDPGSDRGFLEAQIRDAWSRMAADSPNATGGPRRLTLARTGPHARALHPQSLALAATLLPHIPPRTP